MQVLGPWEFLLAVAGWVWLRRHREAGSAPVQKNWRRNTVLLVLTGLAAAAWLSSGLSPLRNHIHHHEWTHYYLGSKYATELSYTRLYECITVADAQDTNHPVQRITDLRTNHTISTREILDNPDSCRQHFAVERWSEFRHDVAYFRDRIDSEGWTVLLNDHGYNATPVWTMLAGPLANLAPVDTQIHLLALLDPLYLVAMLLAICWGFGWRTMCVAVLMLATFLPARSLWTAGAFLRWDWLFYAVLAVCLLKKGRPLIAGVVLGYATLLRVFPGVLFLGLVCMLAWCWARHRRLDEQSGRVLAGGALAAAVLVPMTLLATGGSGAWTAFADNLMKTNQTPMSNTVGLTTLLRWRPGNSIEDLYDPLAEQPADVWTRGAQHATEQVAPLLIVAGIAAIVLLALAARGNSIWVSAALGVAVLPFVTNLLSYYYMAIIVLALLWQERDHRIGEWLFGLCVMTQAIGRIPVPGMSDWLDQKYVLLSAATVIGFGVLLVLGARNGGPRPRGARKVVSDHDQSRALAG